MGTSRKSRTSRTFCAVSLRGFESVGHGKQVVSVAAVDAAPAKMVGEPGRLGALDQILQAAQVLAVGTFGGAKIHRDAVLDHAVLLENVIQDVQRAAAVDHEIFGNDFKPVHDRLASENVVVMREPAGRCRFRNR